MTGPREIIPIVYTPFDAADRVVERDVRRLVDHLIAAGAHGLAATGGASEAAKLSREERQDLATIVIDQAAGRQRGAAPSRCLRARVHARAKHAGHGRA